MYMCESTTLKEAVITSALCEQKVFFLKYIYFC